MGHGSRSGHAKADLERADSVLRRRRYNGLTFTSVAKAVGWYFEARERMQSPNGLHPRGEPGPNGEMVYLSVDGGRGGDIDEVLTTVSTIGRFLRCLQEDYPVPHQVLVLKLRDGKSYRQIGEQAGLAPSSCSAEHGKAEAYLVAGLREAGVLR